MTTPDRSTCDQSDPTTNEPVVDVRGLTLRYGHFYAVRDLSFRVQREEIYALLGTNGAGKTSALEVIQGHRAATSGTVRVFGRDPDNRSHVRPRLGIMLQESGFAADLTVVETVRLIGSLTHRHDTAERVLSMVELTHKATTLVSHLSGGERRRLDFATAAWGSPELIMLDEPTTGLDISSRDRLWRTVQRLRHSGSTIVLTTHYLEEAQQHADRIGVMHQGRLHREGTVAELTQRLPGYIRFRLDAHITPPPQAIPSEEGSYTVTTARLPHDMKNLLAWSEQHDVELHDLSAGPVRLDDVFRDLDPQPTPT